MAGEDKFILTQKVDDEERKELNVGVLTLVTDVLVNIFEDEILNAGTKEEIESLIFRQWDISCIIMANAGMRVLGYNSSGNVVAVFNPQIKEWNSD